MPTQRTSQQPPVLWQPDPMRRDSARVTHYLDWLTERGLATLSGYHELWRWSVEESESFWTSLIGYFDVDFRGELAPALASSAMPGASWFPNLEVNYAASLAPTASDTASD
jgi:acetoacetyl-CoA synthetase